MAGSICHHGCDARSHLAAKSDVGPFDTDGLFADTGRGASVDPVVEDPASASGTSRHPPTWIPTLFRRGHPSALPRASQEVRARAESPARQPVRRGAERLQDDPRGVQEGGVHRTTPIRV